LTQPFSAQVVHPPLVKARAASVAISLPILALNRSDAQSQRKSADGVALSILIPSSLENVRPCFFISTAMTFVSLGLLIHEIFCELCCEPFRIYFSPLRV
jgi:hypothetical protein